MLEIHCQRVSGSWRFLFIHFPLRGVLWIQIIFKVICEHAPWLLLLFLFSVDWHCSNVKLLFKLYGVFHRPNPRMAQRACSQQAHWPCFLLSRAPDSGWCTCNAFPGLSQYHHVHQGLFCSNHFRCWISPQRQNQNALLGCKSIYKLPTWSVTPGLSSSWADVNESTSDFINRHLLMNSMLAMIYFPCSIPTELMIPNHWVSRICSILALKRYVILYHYTVRRGSLVPDSRPDFKRVDLENSGGFRFEWGFRQKSIRMSLMSRCGYVHCMRTCEQLPSSEEIFPPSEQ